MLLPLQSKAQCKVKFTQLLVILVWKPPGQNQLALSLASKDDRDLDAWKPSQSQSYSIDLADFMVLLLLINTAVESDQAPGGKK